MTAPIQQPITPSPALARLSEAGTEAVDDAVGGCADAMMKRVWPCRRASPLADWQHDGQDSNEPGIRAVLKTLSPRNTDLGNNKGRVSGVG